MSYLGYSVKEAIEGINAPVNGWFLPKVQRPFVWGSRYENEIYICKLFDSIFRGYPIGGLIVWNTDEEVPYREFITDYNIMDGGAKIVEQGLWGRKDKWLVYDGQQRLQTLYSCLRYTFNDKILINNLLFKKTEDTDPNETGFSFVEKNSLLNWNEIRMNELFSKQSDEKIRYEREVLRKAGELSEDDEELVRNNIDILWKIFVEKDKKSLSYFPISTKDENEVNEIFERLNTGGIPLSLADLLFSKIKADYTYFEENLQAASKIIASKTGIYFSHYFVLQLTHLIVTGRIRVDPKKIKQSQTQDFDDAWKKLETPLEVFFVDFLFGLFRINNSAIIPRTISMFPIIVYFYELYGKGYQFKDLSQSNLKLLRQYFIKSQINDWSLQSYIDNFTYIVIEESQNSGTELFDFPLEGIEAFINKQKRRQVEINEETFMGYVWFGLKVLTPAYHYQFEPNNEGRFNPEIDHIFPYNLKGATSEYQEAVNVIWNLMPIKGDYNGFKSNIHPKLFFTDQAARANGEKIVGSKYVNNYEFLFPKNANGQIDFSNGIWENPFEFVQQRRQLMIEFLKANYGITLIEKQEEISAD